MWLPSEIKLLLHDYQMTFDLRSLALFNFNLNKKINSNQRYLAQTLASHKSAVRNALRNMELHGVQYQSMSRLIYETREHTIKKLFR